MRRYFEGRAAGISRTHLRRELELTWSHSTLIGIKWNALTYAGHTVWNVHAHKPKGAGYDGGHKRRPREQWHINEGTHAALISTAEAEAILEQLATSEIGAKVSAAKGGAGAW